MKENNQIITDVQEIFRMLENCTTINVGINADEYPYVVPMTFGCAVEDEKLVVYFHCAGQGKKWELLHRDPHVCVEAHIYERVASEEPGKITAFYDSVIGYGKACLIEDRFEKVDAIKLMLAHYDSSGFPATSCNGLKRVEVYRIVLDNVTGKRSK